MKKNMLKGKGPVCKQFSPILSTVLAGEHRSNLLLEKRAINYRHQRIVLQSQHGPHAGLRSELSL